MAVRATKTFKASGAIYSQHLGIVDQTYASMILTRFDYSSPPPSPPAFSANRLLSNRDNDGSGKSFPPCLALRAVIGLVLRFRRTRCAGLDSHTLSCGCGFCRPQGMRYIEKTSVKRRFHVQTRIRNRLARKEESSFARHQIVPKDSCHNGRS